jgi:hypothetical protein
MRTGNEGGIAEQRNPTEDHLKRLQIERCLKQGLLGSGDDRRSTDYEGARSKRQRLSPCDGSVTHATGPGRPSQ